MEIREPGVSLPGGVAYPDSTSAGKSEAGGGGDKLGGIGEDEEQSHTAVAAAPPSPSAGAGAANGAGATSAGAGERKREGGREKE